VTSAAASIPELPVRSSAQVPLRRHVIEFVVTAFSFWFIAWILPGISIGDWAPPRRCAARLDPQRDPLAAHRALLLPDDPVDRRPARARRERSRSCSLAEGLLDGLSIDSAGKRCSHRC
jgi:hypothetical protein